MLAEGLKPTRQTSAPPSVEPITRKTQADFKRAEPLQKDRNGVPAVKGIGKAEAVNLGSLSIPAIGGEAAEDMKKEIALLLKSATGHLTRSDLTNALASVKSLAAKSTIQDLLDAFDKAQKEKTGRLASEDAVAMQARISAMLMVQQS